LLLWPPILGRVLAHSPHRAARIWEGSLPVEPGVSRQRSQAHSGCVRRCRSVQRIAEAIAHPAGNAKVSAGQAWAHSFLFAGLSALLLAVSAMRPGIIFLHCLALIPFFYGFLLRKNHSVGPADGVRLGFLLGLSYLGVTLADSLVVSPTAALLKLAGGTSLFALFGWAAGQSRHRWGFNSLILACLWVVFEFVLIKLGLISDILSTEAMIGRSVYGPVAVILYKTAAVFGILALSFIIVLLNLVFTLAIDVLVTMATARGMALPESEETRDLFLTPGLIAQRLYCVAAQRGPPSEPFDSWPRDNRPARSFAGE